MREPQQDRSRLTRQRLLEATIDCLADQGWAATTVGVVAKRAGVSRGAAQHHFPTREDLITAALEFMFDSRMEAARLEATGLPAGPGRTEAIVTRLVEYYTGTLFKAALQVWTAAATSRTTTHPATTSNWGWDRAWAGRRSPPTAHSTPRFARPRPRRR